MSDTTFENIKTFVGSILAFLAIPFLFAIYAIIVIGYAIVITSFIWIPLLVVGGIVYTCLGLFV